MVILVFLPSLPLLLPSQAEAFYLGEDRAVFQPVREERNGVRREEMSREAGGRKERRGKVCGGK